MKVGPFIISDMYICGDSIYYGKSFLRPYNYSYSVTDLFIQKIKRKND